MVGFYLGVAKFSCCDDAHVVSMHLVDDREDAHAHFTQAIAALEAQRGEKSHGHLFTFMSFEQLSEIGELAAAKLQELMPPEDRVLQ